MKKVISIIIIFLASFYGYSQTPLLMLERADDSLSVVLATQPLSGKFYQKYYPITTLNSLLNPNWTKVGNHMYSNVKKVGINDLTPNYNFMVKDSIGSGVGDNIMFAGDRITFDGLFIKKSTASNEYGVLIQGPLKFQNGAHAKGGLMDFTGVGTAGQVWTSNAAVSANSWASSGGDVSGAYTNLQLGTDVVGIAEADEAAINYWNKAVNDLDYGAGTVTVNNDFFVNGSYDSEFPTSSGLRNLDFGSSNLSALTTGTYNYTFGLDNLNAAAAPNYNTVIGYQNLLSATNLSYAAVFGRRNFFSTTGAASYLFGVGLENLRNVTGTPTYITTTGFRNFYLSSDVDYSVAFGYLNNGLGVGNVDYTFLSGFQNCYDATSLLYVFANGLSNMANALTVSSVYANGASNGFTAITQITNTYFNGVGNAQSVTGSINNSFFNGASCANLVTADIEYSFFNGSNIARVASAASGFFASGKNHFFATTGSVSNSIAIGWENGRLETGAMNNSIYLGFRQAYSVGVDEANPYRLAIGMYQDDELIYGEFDNDLIRIQGDLTVRDDITVDGVGTIDGIDIFAPSSGSTVVGNGAGATTTGTANTFLGDNAGSSNITGTSNTYIGSSTGSSSTGSSNVFIGANAGGSELGSNKLYIDVSGTATPLIQGDFVANSITVNGDLTVTSRTGTPDKNATFDSGGLLVEEDRYIIGTMSRNANHNIATSTDWTVDFTVSEDQIGSITNSILGDSIEVDVSGNYYVIGVSFRHSGVPNSGKVHLLVNGLQNMPMYGDWRFENSNLYPHTFNVKTAPISLSDNDVIKLTIENTDVTNTLAVQNIVLSVYKI